MDPDGSGRRERSDLGCTLPEEGFSFYSAEGIDDDNTVVMGNLDSRPSQVGNLERLQGLAAISQEERDARDRQLIQMYLRSGKYHRNHTNNRRRRSSPPSTGVASSTSRQLSHNSLPIKLSPMRQVPENFYPYYDLVVASNNSSRSIGSQEDQADSKHEVIVPPFSPVKKY